MEISVARRNRGGDHARKAQVLMHCAKPTALNTAFHPTPLHHYRESSTFCGTSRGLLEQQGPHLLNYCIDKATNALPRGSARVPAPAWSTSSQPSTTQPVTREQQSQQQLLMPRSRDPHLPTEFSWLTKNTSERTQR